MQAALQTALEKLRASPATESAKGRRHFPANLLKPEELLDVIY
jgi:hypothetical protein